MIIYYKDMHDWRGNSIFIKDILTWCEDNCEGTVINNVDGFSFTYKSDAILFTLYWR
jgi:hypothetical protein